MHARRSTKEEVNASNNNGHVEYQAVEEHYEAALDSFITQLPIETELTMEEISAFQTSIALEMAVANEIEDPAPWVDVSVLGSTPLIPPPEEIQSSYVALPTGIASYVDLPFAFNVSSTDYIYPEDVEALLDGTIGDIAATVDEHDAEDLIKELMDNAAVDGIHGMDLQQSQNVQVPVETSSEEVEVANAGMTLKVTVFILNVSNEFSRPFLFRPSQRTRIFVAAWTASVIIVPMGDAWVDVVLIILASRLVMWYRNSNNCLNRLMEGKEEDVVVAKAVAVYQQIIGPR